MDSIIFDLDGTLWDPTDVVLIAWNNILKNHKEVKNEITKENLKGTMGLQIKEIGRKLFPYLDEGIQQKVLDECCKVECQYIAEQGGRLYDNLEETLKTLSNKYKLYIVSNCQSGCISQLKIEPFRNLILSQHLMEKIARIRIEYVLS